MVLASSAGGVYAGSPDLPPFTERSEAAALAPYGVAKLEMERIADRLTGRGTRLLVARIANLYGPGQDLTKPQGLISQLCLTQQTGRALNLHVSLDTLRDYLFVSDAAAMLIAALDLLAGEEPGTTVTKILASGRAFSVAAVVGESRRVFRRRPLLSTRAVTGSPARDLRLRSVVWPQVDVPGPHHPARRPGRDRGRHLGPAAGRRDAARMLRRHRADLAWLLLAVGAVWLAWGFPLLLDGRHYFQGDTQNAYYGWFHHLGSSLLDGRWPILDAQAGTAGNPLAEGQEGLYSPLSALIGIGAAVAPQLVVYVTLVKLAIATIATTGCFLLARGYAVRPGLAAVAAVAVQLGGFTLSADAPRWIAGQLVAALLPWAWWAARRTLAGAHPWPALVAGGLLVTTGYVFGTMYFILVLGGLLLECLVTRQWSGVRRLLLLGVFCGLLTVTVYLPGILTSPVTFRNTWEIGGTPGYMQMDPVFLLLTGQPTAVPSTVSLLSSDQHAAAVGQISFTYVAWFLPLVCWVGFSRLRRTWTSLISLVVPFVLTVVWTLLPYNMGPIRMPGRVMSIVTLTGVLLLVVLLERTLEARPGRRRLGLSLAWVGLGRDRGRAPASPVDGDRARCGCGGGGLRRGDGVGGAAAPAAAGHHGPPRPWASRSSSSLPSPTASAGSAARRARSRRTPTCCPTPRATSSSSGWTSTPWPSTPSCPARSCPAACGTSPGSPCTTGTPPSASATTTSASACASTATRARTRCPPCSRSTR